MNADAQGSPAARALAQGKDYAGPQPWEQMEGEKDADFAKFMAYKNLGPKRKLLEAQIKHTGKQAAAIAGNWAKLSTTFNWPDRAAAYDKHLGTLTSQLKEGDLLEADRASRNAITNVLKRLDAIVSEPDPGKQTAALREFGPILVNVLGKGKAGDFLLSARRVLFGQKVIHAPDPLDIPLDDFIPFGQKKANEQQE